MAGSFKHVIVNDGSLASNDRVVAMLENGGDVFEAVEEMYGMIWYLATEGQKGQIWDWDPAAKIEEARQNYQEGLVRSPTKRYK